MTSLVDSITCFGLGLGLLLLGRWGMRNAEHLVPATLSEHERERKERVLSRGSLACQFLAVVFFASGLLRPLI